MRRIAVTVPRTIGILTLLALMTACGGGGGSGSTASNPPPVSNNPGTDNPPSSPVQGVATPSNIAVVTATNAN